MAYICGPMLESLSWLEHRIHIRQLADGSSSLLRTKT